MSDSFLPKAAEKAPKKDVFVSDYRYASDVDIQNVTVNHLAKLEAELHTMRMMFIANGRDPKLMVAPDRPLVSEMSKLEASISDLTEFFQPILNP